MITDRKRFGLILRVFSRSEDQVERNAQSVVVACKKAMDLKLRGGWPFFARVLILVAADPNYPDCDCGKTAAAIRGMLRKDAVNDVLEVQHGDIFCGVLNYGMAKMLRDRIDFVTIMSHDAADYLTVDVMTQVIEALEKGAAVAGVAIKELSEGILEGRVANTFATWNALKLMTVGGFDLRASQPKKDDPTTMYLRGWSAEKKGEVFYPRAGVEEIIPLLRLGRTFGPCIAPIMPKGFAQWRAPDPATDQEGYERHIKKMGTKFQRQSAHAAFENADLDALKAYVLPEYRTF